MPTVPNLTLNNGVELPAIGLGVFQTPPEETRAAVEAALSPLCQDLVWQVFNLNRCP
jgi:hypothetical protein